ncbi:MAG: SprT-like domain-containing protein [Actinomycetes bacterium]|nr:SprT-like domain-containing protein [Actinomycetes bacterium]MDX5380767.1 SprT-like domain-containing protein [Actinomycetes bacterium]MDX5399782.1 SprT-like domain-containing protein [Actinomycetes bacterium]MDX5450507.1 SprT-like domain-containing protein [Actinomycetes bacterium]
MDLRDVRLLATGLMSQHGVGDWQLGWDNARTRAGMCRFGTRTISLSRHLMVLYEPEQVREVVLHEIAHALVGPQHNHDSVWRAKAREIGSSGARALPADSPRPPAPWVGRCPLGHEFHRYKRPPAQSSCSRCSSRFDARFLLEWHRRGQAPHAHAPIGGGRPE